jgi:hypothetical protein
VSASTTGSSRSHGTDVSAARPRFSINRNESSPLSFRLGFLFPLPPSDGRSLLLDRNDCGAREWLMDERYHARELTLHDVMAFLSI